MQPIQTRSKKEFLDPRTKILLVFTIAAVVVGGGHGYWLAPIRILLISVPFMPVSYTHLRAHETS